MSRLSAAEIRLAYSAHETAQKLIGQRGLAFSTGKRHTRRCVVARHVGDACGPPPWPIEVLGEAATYCEAFSAAVAYLSGESALYWDLMSEQFVIQSERGEDGTP